MYIYTHIHTYIHTQILLVETSVVQDADQLQLPELREGEAAATVGSDIRSGIIWRLYYPRMLGI